MKGQKGETNILQIILVITLLVLTGTTVYFWQQNKVSKNMLMTQKPGAKAKINENSTSNDISTALTQPANNIDSKQPAPETPSESKAVAVYVPSGLFDETEKSELNKKVVEPMTFWNEENENPTATITIEKPIPAIPDYKYKINYINKNGSNGGFLFGTSTPLEWWLPECLNGCNLSAEFKTKFPEIAAQVQ